MDREKRIQESKKNSAGGMKYSVWNNMLEFMVQRNKRILENNFQDLNHPCNH